MINSSLINMHPSNRSFKYSYNIYRSYYIDVWSYKYYLSITYMHIEHQRYKQRYRTRTA